MDHITRWWVAGTSAALLSMNTSEAQPVPLDMVVRVYNIAGLPRGDIVTAQGVAEKVFRRAGIQLRWRGCSAMSLGPADDLCTEPLQPREVIGRLATGGNHLSARVLGQAIVIDGQVSTMLTIFADRITVAATRLNMDRAPLLGRTLAHELGHLLLGTNSHAAYGLMMGMWPDAVMRNDTGTHWNFTNRQAQQMKVGLMRRTEGASGRQLRAVTMPGAKEPS
jgi:hypothetical protein